MGVNQGATKLVGLRLGNARFQIYRCSLCLYFKKKNRINPALSTATSGWVYFKFDCT
jgi:hypothetical protein